VKQEAASIKVSSFLYFVNAWLFFNYEMGGTAGFSKKTLWKISFRISFEPKCFMMTFPSLNLYNRLMKKILILPYYLDEKLKDLDYLSEGILEELLSLISSNPNVKTTSRTTSLYLK
jgi:hypothetical protein